MVLPTPPPTPHIIHITILTTLYRTMFPDYWTQCHRKWEHVQSFQGGDMNDVSLQWYKQQHAA